MYETAVVESAIILQDIDVDINTSDSESGSQSKLANESEVKEDTCFKRMKLSINLGQDV